MDDDISWLYCLAFPTEVKKKTAGEIELERSELLEQLGNAKLKVQLFYSSTKKVVFCKVGATDERLLLEADIGQYLLELEPTAVKKVAESDLDLKKYGRAPIFLDYPYKEIPKIHHDFKEYNALSQSWKPMAPNAAGAYSKTNIPPFKSLFVRYNDVWEKRILDDHDVQIYKTYPDGSILRPADRIKLMKRAIERSTAKDAEHGLPGAGINAKDMIFAKRLVAVYPLQLGTSRQAFKEMTPDQLFAEWNSACRMPWDQPEDKVRDYAGEKIAMYFAFLGHYTLWLVAPSLFGLAVFAHQVFELNSITGGWDVIGPGAANVTYTNITDPDTGNVTGIIAESELYTKVPEAPYFALFIALWASFMIEFWKRKQARLALKWGMANYEKVAETRPEFKPSHLVPSPVTGEPEEYYSKTTFLAKLAVSASVIFTAICVVLAGIIGVVILKVLASKDNAFLPPSVAPQAALVVNAIMIIILGIVYKGVAKSLNDWENHRTDIEYEDHLISKTFLFSFINSYSALTYMAFIKSGQKIDGSMQFCIGDAEQISQELQRFTNFTDSANEQLADQDQCYAALSYSLLIIFLSQIIVNNTMEVALPWLKARVLALLDVRAHAKNVAKGAKAVGDAVGDAATAAVDVVVHKKDDEDPDEEEKQDIEVDLDDPAVRQRLKSPIEHQLYLQEYETPFDDYLELALQFGYVTLFVAAFPIAPFFALLNNFLEVRVDSYKICKLCRRPDIASTQDIGTWQTIFQIMGFAAVVSNSAVILFTADFYSVSDANRVWLFLGFITVVLSLKTLVDWAIPDEPTEVTIQKQRNEFIERKIFGLERDDEELSPEEKKRNSQRLSLQRNILQVDPFIDQLMRRAAAIFRDNAPVNDSLDAIFKSVDTDGDKTISITELQRGLAADPESLIKYLSKYEIQILCNSMDTNGDGEISKAEFLAFLRL